MHGGMRILVAAFVVCGCSSEPPQDGATASGLEPAVMVDELAAAQCERIIACCSESERELFFGAATVADESSCRSALTGRSEAFWQPSLERARAEATIVISRSGLDACVAAVSGEACDTFEPQAEGEILTHPGCEDVVEPRLTLSAFCSDDYECETAFCSHPPGDPIGACKNAPQVDEPCLHDRCAAGLRCTPDGVCAHRLAIGEPCAEGPDCDSAFCDVALDVPVCDAARTVCGG